MSYKIYLRGGIVKTVPDEDGRLLKQMFLDPSVTRRTPIEVSGYATELSKVTAVQPVTGMQNTPDFSKDYAETLETYAGQSVEEKVRRELDARIKPGLTEKMLAKIDFEKVRGVVKHFLENNPEYPWCPMVVWEDIVLFDLTASKFYELVILNDAVVADWLEKRVS